MALSFCFLVLLLRRKAYGGGGYRAESCASLGCGEPVVVVSDGVWFEAPAGAVDLVDHDGVAFCLDAGLFRKFMVRPSGLE